MSQSKDETKKRTMSLAWGFAVCLVGAGVASLSDRVDLAAGVLIGGTVMFIAGSVANG